MTSLPDIHADYIIVGGGTAGCVLAHRLSAKRDCQVLLLEAGGEGPRLLTDVPAGSFLLMGRKDCDWVYAVQPDASVGGRTTPWAAGRMLGGSSAINGLVYTRGLRGDYDQWAQSGCPGWGFDDLWPYFLKAERYHGNGESSHGHDGLLDVSPPRTLHPLAATFVEACVQSGLPRCRDPFGGAPCGVYYTPGTTRAGHRCSTRVGYLDPVRKRPNLTVLTRCEVQRLLIEDGRASGVVAVHDSTQRRFRARAEVLVCAGVIGSPALLLRSGIGPAAELASCGIDIHADLPGVGANVQEHCGVSQSRLVDVVTYNTLGLFGMTSGLMKFIMTGRGPMSSIAVQAMAYVRSAPERVEPDMVLSFLPLCIDFTGGAPSMHKRPGVTIGVHPGRPAGRGRIRLNKADPGGRPLIEYQLLADERDLRTLICGCRKIADIFRAPALAQHVLADSEPESVPDDDAGWEAFIRRRAGIGYHGVGSCRMGKDAAAVVDPGLRVYGVSGLRVIDASVMPNIISGNTNAATIAIAEKAADLLRLQP